MTFVGLTWVPLKEPLPDGAVPPPAGFPDVAGCATFAGSALPGFPRSPAMLFSLLDGNALPDGSAEMWSAGCCHPGDEILNARTPTRALSCLPRGDALQQTVRLLTERRHTRLTPTGAGR